MLHARPLMTIDDDVGAVVQADSACERKRENGNNTSRKTREANRGRTMHKRNQYSIRNKWQGWDVMANIKRRA